jgi:epoxyqueuosine reductase QueG
MDVSFPALIQNTIHAYEVEKGLRDFWRVPLTALISADNPLFEKLKEAVSPDHFLPEDLLPGAKSVISYFIPFHERIIGSNLEGDAASEEWAKAYIFTNDLISRLNDRMEEALAGIGFQTGKTKATHNFDEKTLMSRWSQRHIAWIGGLGTFGINNMLITEKGCGGRFGSLVTDCPPGELERRGFPAAGRPAPERCLYKINGSCGLCQKKCPAGAYEAGVFNRKKCYELCLKNAALHKALGFADVCGKCVAGLPCSTEIPGR